MDANVTLDVGKNITGLIQQLATQIGTTADKVFPWYVKQSVFEGYANLGMTCVLVVICFIISGLSFYIANKTKNKEWLGGNIIAGGLFIITLMFTCANISETITKIKNPEYHAMKNITTDIGRMVNK